MKVRPSVKPMCEKCKIIKRKGRVMLICENPNHTQRKAKKELLESKWNVLLVLTCPAKRESRSL